MQAAQPQKKKGCSTGCWIAIAVVGGLFLIVGGIGAYAAYQVYQDPDVKKAIAVIGDGVEIIQDAQGAEGTDELNDDYCRDAMVFDVDKLLDFAEEHSEEDFDRPEVKVEKLIVCNAKKKNVECSDVAETYVDAASPKKNFAVIVNKKGGDQCQEHFDEDGESQGDFQGNVPIPDMPEGQ
jgi:hypothetical protein